MIELIGLCIAVIIAEFILLRIADRIWTRLGPDFIEAQLLMEEFLENSQRE